MSMTRIHERLQDIARAVFDDDQLTLAGSTRARDVKGWDSLGHLTFMCSVEDELGVEFTEIEFAGFETVGELEVLLERKLSSSMAD